MIPALLAATLVQADAAAPRFNPPLDGTFRYETVQTRDEAGARERFVLVRSLCFLRDGDGFTAILTVDQVEGGIASGPGAMFDAAMAALKNVPVRFHLDAQGRVVSIEDQAALMARLRDAIVTHAADAAKIEPAKRAAFAARLAGALTAMPDALQRRMLASMIEPVLADPGLPDAPAPAAPIAQAGKSPFGGTADMKGTRRSWIDAEGLLAIEDRLSGTATGPNGAPAALSSIQQRSLNRATRLVMHGIVRRAVMIDGRTGMTETRFDLSEAPK